MGSTWHRESIPGLFTVGKPAIGDHRGLFHKILSDIPQGYTPLLFDEIYWSQSESGVARGLHLQVPPFHGRKLVFATSGRVRDFVLDLRKSSPTWHQVWSAELSFDSTGVLIPAGCAHGFEVLDGPATLIYAQEGAYNKEADQGINMLSVDQMRLSHGLQFSERDTDLPALADFNSPFDFCESEHGIWNQHP